MSKYNLLNTFKQLTMVGQFKKKIQGWEFAHLISERIARFLSKKLANEQFTQKNEQFTHSLIFSERNERFAHIAHFL